VKKPRSDFFSANAGSYDKSRQSHLSDSARDAIVGVLRVPSEGRLLDVAAGTGRVAIPIAGAGYRVVAVDRSQEMLRILRGKVTTEPVTVLAAAGASLPFDKRTFHGVLIARLLYLTPDWQQILTESLRVLAAGGYLLHEWANGTPSDPSVQIKEYLRTLLEDGGVATPFHTGVRFESEVDTFLAESRCALVDTIVTPLEGGMPVRDFLGRIESGEFSYTWSAPASVRDRCVAALRCWVADHFDMDAPAFGTHTSWKVFAPTAR
jgi:ubiquinone/menaquinone biosynthesis C-methylase UbiE